MYVKDYDEPVKKNTKALQYSLPVQRLRNTFETSPRI